MPQPRTLTLTSPLKRRLLHLRVLSENAAPAEGDAALVASISRSVGWALPDAAIALLINQDDTLAQWDMTLMAAPRHIEAHRRARGPRGWIPVGSDPETNATFALSANAARIFTWGAPALAEEELAAEEETLEFESEEEEAAFDRRSERQRMAEALRHGVPLLTWLDGQIAEAIEALRHGDGDARARTQRGIDAAALKAFSPRLNAPSAATATHAKWGQGRILEDQGDRVLIAFQDGAQRVLLKRFLN